MADSFKYDVFLSHSSADNEAVRELAQRLRNDGLRVWFDEWEIKAGDSIPAKIEDGLEHSRVLVLCMSANAFGSDWAQLEAGMFRFRDPMNHERRLIPLRFDDAPIKGSLGQFKHINWLPKDREQGYTELLEACQPGGKPPAETADFEAPPPLNRGQQQTHDLRITVHPTGNHLCLLAQIRLLNAGERPILIDSWFVEWSDRSFTNSVVCTQGTLPVRLQDHERADLIVDVSEHPVEELKSLGVLDAERRFWHADPKDIRGFIHVAKPHEPPRINADPDEPSEPSRT